MRILYHHRIGSKDGQAVHLEELIAALRSQGHEVCLVGPKAFTRASFGHDPKLIAWLKKAIPQAGYETLELAYNLVAFFRLRRACRRFRPEVIYERYNLYLLAGIWFSRASKIPILLEVNAPLSEERKNFGGLGFPWLARQLERLTWRNADVVFTVTNVLASYIAEAGVLQQVEVVPNAIDPAKFAAETDPDDAKRELGLSGKVVLGFIGFVREWNGLEVILELLARPGAPTNLNLMIVGDGPAIPPLKVRAKHLDIIDRVTFTGLVGRDHMAKYLAAFDIALLPKCVSYCSPLKLFEYMGSGKAIVAPDQPNIREVLNDGEQCALFPPANFDAMTDAILQLANNETARKRLGHAAQKLILSRGFTWGDNAQRVSRIAESAVERRRIHDAGKETRDPG